MLGATPAHGIRRTDVRLLFEIRGGFKAPSDVSVSKDGRIYVVDGVNNRISIFDQDGKSVSSFGRKGRGPGQFQAPLGIDVDSTGRVYVADSGNHRIQVFDSSGRYIAETRLPSKNDRLADPTDVLVDISGNRFFVVDNDNHAILLFDLLTQSLIKSCGAPGTRELQFRFPFLLAQGRDKNLYVVDVVNTRVQVLSPDGWFVTFIGGWGVKKGEFFRPKGVAIDQNNLIYVSDSYTGVIQIFTSTGEFHSVLGDPTKGGVRKFNTPCGMFIDGNNRLYVVEMSADKVSVFTIVDHGESN